MAQVRPNTQTNDDFMNNHVIARVRSHERWLKSSFSCECTRISTAPNMPQKEQLPRILRDSSGCFVGDFDPTLGPQIVLLCHQNEDEGPEENFDGDILVLSMVTGDQNIPHFCASIL